MKGDTYTLSNAKVRDVADFYKKFVMVCLGVAPWILVVILNSWTVDSHPCPTSWVNHGEGFFLNLSQREAVPGSLSLSLHLSSTLPCVVSGNVATRHVLWLSWLSSTPAILSSLVCNRDVQMLSLSSILEEHDEVIGLSLLHMLQ